MEFIEVSILGFFMVEIFLTSYG